MAVLKVTRQPAFRLAVVAGEAQSVTFQVVGKWRLVVIEAGAAGAAKGHPWAF
jgi:ABC-type enterobactin transport system permease subunit